MVDRDEAAQLPTEPPLSGDRPSAGTALFSSDESRSGVLPTEHPASGDRQGSPPGSGDTEVPAFTSLALVAVHEISNVLSWLDMTLELIERRETSRAEGERAPAQDLSSAIRDARLGVEHMSAIVHELRSFGRPAVGVEETFDPTDALRAAIHFSEARIARRAHLRVSIDSAPPVRGSRHELTCVFLNLLLNAAEAMAEGSPDANVVDIRARTDDHGRAVFEIEDTGRGIAPELGDHIFDPYFTGRAERGGTGLGLHVSWRIVHAMGGKITFESALGLGSLFRVVLPSAE